MKDGRDRVVDGTNMYVFAACIGAKLVLPPTRVPNVASSHTFKVSCCGLYEAWALCETLVIFLASPCYLRMVLAMQSAYPNSVLAS